MKAKMPNKELFVGDLSFDIEEEDLRKLFSVCGTVRSIHLITDQKSGQFKGCAFVRMATAAEAKEALNMLDGTRLLDRCIRVCASRPKQVAPVVQPEPEKPQRSRRRPRGRRK